jgi:tRNA 2-thiouridine synthesizing protein A
VNYSANQKLDASGLNCPLPLLKAKQALNGMESGEILNVICTDSGSVRDFRVFCEQSGNQLLQSSEENGTYIYFLRKL